MKCPKCQYISFDSGDRCRNCGYDFSLVPDAGEHAVNPDLPIQTGAEALGPLADFALNETPNLPLFTGDRRDPDTPLVTAGAAPRAPLAVRRAAPVPPRPRPRRENPDVEPRLALDTAELPVVPAPAAVAQDEAQREERAPDNLRTAGAGARLAGGVVDLLLLGGIDVAVVYFTLRICDLTFAQAPTLPLAPLVLFLVLLNGGYLAAFVAASGQTIGKMAAGTRVVSAVPDAPMRERVSFEQAVVRAAASVISALPLGLGFIPALVGERRALHDRLADTRVIKA